MISRIITLVTLVFLIINHSFSQIVTPVKWTFETKQGEGNKAELIFHATIDRGWHIFSQKQPEGGPTKTSFEFIKNKGYTLVDNVSEPKPHKAYEDLFGVDVLSFEKKIEFKQTIQINTDKTQIIKGVLQYGACDTNQCLPPEKVNFEFKVNGVKVDALINKNVVVSPIDTSGVILNKTEPSINNDSKITNATTEESTNVPSTRSLFILFLEGLLAGFAALLTPCVFPMIPMTVSFFTKRSKTRAKGILNALIYSTSIIIIYVSLGLFVSKVFGSDALNALSTNVYFNLFFFFLLVVFAISFLGAFEIVLPSKFINKVDAQSERGGLIGIFFMAFTLALVSFSCTGPLVGTVLVESATSGAVSGPFWVMFGFALALAFPFGFFAAFPGWLNSLPKSGGWLNSVKVFLGFLELALALKFLSNADLVMQAGFLTREVFLTLWITIFALLTFYLLGWIRFSHDSKLEHLSVPRLMVALITLAFTVYLIPGLTNNAPLKLIAGFPPPDFYSENAETKHTTSSVSPVAQTNHCPNDLPCLHDYEEGLSEAKKQNKPLLIDFTGWACVNCRKMESQVWTDEGVDKILRNDVVLVSLYVDDKRELPANEQTKVKLGDKEYSIETIGNKWSYMQASRYKTNSQPQYILLDHNENMLDAPMAYNPNIKNYINWLDNGITKFKNSK